MERQRANEIRLHAETRFLFHTTAIKEISAPYEHIRPSDMKQPPNLSAHGTHFTQTGHRKPVRHPLPCHTITRGTAPHLHGALLWSGKGRISKIEGSHVWFAQFLLPVLVYYCFSSHKRIIINSSLYSSLSQIICAVMTRLSD